MTAPEIVARMVLESRKAQGLPPTVEEQSVLGQIVDLVDATEPQRSRAATTRRDASR